MFFVLDESVVRRWVGAKPGDAKIMLRQLKRLQELNEQPRMSIQILRFTHGFHFGMQGAFTMLEFPDPEDDELLFLDNRAASVTAREGADVIAHYKDEFYRLEAAALPRDRLGGYLDGIIDEMS